MSHRVEEISLLSIYRLLISNLVCQHSIAVTSLLFYTLLKKQSRMNMRMIHKEKHDTHIAYTVVEDSLLGYILIAATERGVAVVRFGDTEQLLADDLRSEYPEAQRDDEKLQPLRDLLQRSMQEDPMPTVPLDISATVFQWKVWEALRAIPMGQTRSYHDIAEAIGQPTAVRSVARACAANPVAVFIPCHRVIRNNGELAGYRWGLERKRKLLAIEQE
jgi:AraC family transcriptional regulator, regulatory protein of adaptative response / methylated-DNA-[protein]-cysteine methyltransferase